MNINLTLFGQIISFAIFVFLCARYIWPPIIKNLEERQAKISAGLRNAERADHELKKAQQQGQSFIHDAKDQAAKLIEQANKRAGQLVDEARMLATQESERIKGQAVSEIDRQVTQAKMQLRQQVALLAIEGAQKILRSQVDPKTHQAMLNDISMKL